MRLLNFITGKNNENIKYVCKLLNSSKFRKENRKFVIEGLRLCSDALKNNIKIEKIFYTITAYNKSAKLINELIKVATQSFVVDEKIMKNISDTESPQGILCECDFIDYDLNLKTDKNKIILLDNIQNPSNLGAIIRTCDALGLDGVIVSKDSCDIYNPKVLRGSMGSIFRTQILIVDNLKETLINFNKRGLSTIAMVVEDGSIDIRNFKNYDNIALVIGNEGNGIKKEIKDICKYRGKIPIKIGVDSLNAAVAAGIAMWEVMR